MNKKISLSVFALLNFASAAFAAPAADGQQSLLGAFFPLILFVVIFYFFILRPQKKRTKKHEQMVASLAKGDKVVTNGGFFGIIRDVKEDSVILEVAEGIVVRVLKNAIATVIEAEAPKAPEAKASEAEKKEDK